MSDTDHAVEKQRPAHWFKPGVSGNPLGRRKGSRARFSEAFVQDLASIWEEKGIEVLERTARDDPSTFPALLRAVDAKRHFPDRRR